LPLPSHPSDEPLGPGASGRISVLCVDDNQYVADAVRTKLDRAESPYAWKGWLTDASELVACALRDRPDIVLLDVDMPGPDPFAAATELQEKCPNCRIIVFSGHVRKELIERAINAGAWGYVSKNDGSEALVEALRLVGAGEFALSPEVRAIYG
jgi:DNA-binding NarL/FixJ family response regulator